MKTIIHVHQHKIATNRKLGLNLPVFIVRNYKGTRYGHKVKINGPSELIYSQKPLKCGARAWISTQSDVEVFTDGQ